MLGVGFFKVSGDLSSIYHLLDSGLLSRLDLVFNNIGKTPCNDDRKRRPDDLVVNTLASNIRKAVLQKN